MSIWKIGRKDFIQRSCLAIATELFSTSIRAFTKTKQVHMESYFDVIIVGGSYAGLSAALSLGRSLRNVLIIDSGLPCNRQTPHSHNFLTQDGSVPQEIAKLGKHQVAQYPSVSFHEGRAIKGEQLVDGFTITVDNGKQFTGKKLIFATGIADTMPAIKGFADCWGISVIHCPYCHGYEVRGAKTGLIANGDKAAHMASLIHNLTDKLTILTAGKANFTAEQEAKFIKHNIAVVEKEISEIIHEEGYVQSVVFVDGNTMDFKAVYAPLPFTQHCTIVEDLGCTFTEQGFIQVDGLQKTSVAGVYACGDNCSPMRSVSNAVSTGTFCGAMVNMELVTENF